jgi:hypothetical protein
MFDHAEIIDVPRIIRHHAISVARFVGFTDIFCIGGPGVPLTLQPQALCCRPLRGLYKYFLYRWSWGSAYAPPQALCCRPLSRADDRQPASGRAFFPNLPPQQLASEQAWTPRPSRPFLPMLTPVQRKAFFNLPRVKHLIASLQTSRYRPLFTLIRIYPCSSAAHIPCFFSLLLLPPDLWLIPACWTGHLSAPLLHLLAGEHAQTPDESPKQRSTRYSRELFNSHPDNYFPFPSSLLNTL